MQTDSLIELVDPPAAGKVEDLSALKEQLAQLLAEKERRQNENKIKRWSWVGYAKHLKLMESGKKVIAAFGGNRCLGGETVIFDPIANRSMRVDSITDDFHVWAWDGTKRVIARANRPFSKHEQPIYSFTFDDGTTITASPGHLFLMGNGWRPAGDLIPSCGPSAVCQLPSTLEPYQIVQIEDALHSIRTTLSSRSDCLVCPHSDDAPLPTDQETDRYAAQLPIDVLGHTHCDSLAGGQADGFAHSHQRQDCVRPSSMGEHDLIEVRFVASGSQTAHTVSIPVSDLFQDALLSERLSVLLRQEVGFELAGFGISSHASALNECHVERNGQIGHGSECQSTGSPRVSSYSDLGEILGSPLGWQDISEEGIRRALTSCLVSSKHNVVRVEFLRNDVVWDFEVPDFGNYLIGNILNHNTGKTKLGAYMVACHSTGKYPSWWTGKKAKGSVEIWCVGRTAQNSRDIIQAELLGDITVGMGTGMIPKENIIGVRKLAGVPDAVDTIFVRNIFGGISLVGIRSAEQGREKLQGVAKFFVWMDEEPSTNGYDIFSELRMRTMTTGGQVLVTYTPLNGLNDLSRWLMDPENQEFVEWISVTWDDAPHLTASDKKDMLSQMLPHEREAREKGLPVVRAGLIFPLSETKYVVDPFTIPDSWNHVIGMDVAGFGGMTAAILFAQDPKTKVWYACSEYRGERAFREDHAKEIEGWGKGIYIACDPSANRTESDGKKTMMVYRKLGLNIHNADNSVEEGIASLFEALSQDQLKVFSTLKSLREEMRYYQFDERTGKPKKTKDHSVDSFRYGWMRRQEARPMSYFKTLSTLNGVGYARSNEYQPVSAAGY